MNKYWGLNLKTIDFTQFKQAAAKANIVPVYKKIIVDIDTPVSIFDRFKNENGAFLLESVETEKNFGRYSIIGINPFKTVKYENKKLIIQTAGKTEEYKNENPLDYLENDLKKYRTSPNDELPFLHCAIIGYFGFEIFGLVENVIFKADDRLNLPDIYLAYCNQTLVFDHFKNKLYLIYNVICANDDTDETLRIKYNEALKSIEKLENIIFSERKIEYLSYNKTPKKLDINFLTPESEFCKGVNKIKEYIAAGDIFQCVYSLRGEIGISVNPFEIYRALRIINPSPYMFYMNFGDFQLIGSSPETMVRVRNGQVFLKPIAGTRPVMKNEKETQMYADELMEDEKEIAEHLMLLDLGRNDVGRISKPGTVKVTKHMYVERFAHVQHIVSDVCGDLDSSVNVVQALRSSFPAGTVSGAPKIRAIEIIGEQEKIKRNFYAGAVGYITFNNEMDLAITIRSLAVKNNTAYIQTGAGIVYDSIDKNEYQECMNKARSIIEAVYLAETGIEK